MNKSFFTQNANDSPIGNYVLSCLIIIFFYLFFSLPSIFFGGLAYVSLICIAITIWVFIAFLLRSYFGILFNKSLGLVSIVLLFVGPPIALNRIMFQIDGGSGFDGFGVGLGVILYTFGWLGAVIGSWIIILKIDKSKNDT